MAGDASQLVNSKQVNSLQCTTIDSLFAASSRFLVSFSIYFLWFFASNNNNNNNNNNNSNNNNNNNEELDKLIKHKYIVSHIKAQSLSWFGHVQRMPDTRTVKKLFK